ncbi:MAG: UPF0149 family protein [Gammaproteobacteria bacterium]
MAHQHVPEETGSDSGVPDFQTLDALLVEVSAPLGAAESHGVLCGMICAARSVHRDAWVEQVFGGHDAISAGCPHCEAPLTRLFDWTRDALASEEMTFQLYLPDDDTDLDERLHHVSHWCQGFLVGVGLGGADQSAMPEDSAEILRDVAAISRARAEGLEGEDDEQDFMEIVEYLRTAVLLVGEELQSLRPRKVH